MSDSIDFYTQLIYYIEGLLPLHERENFEKALQRSDHNLEFLVNVQRDILVMQGRVYQTPLKEYLQKLVEQYPRKRHIHHPQNLGIIQIQSFPMTLAILQNTFSFQCSLGKQIAVRDSGVHYHRVCFCHERWSVELRLYRTRKFQIVLHPLRESLVHSRYDVVQKGPSKRLCASCTSLNTLSSLSFDYNDYELHFDDSVLGVTVM